MPYRVHIDGVFDNSKSADAMISWLATFGIKASSECDMTEYIGMPSTGTEEDARYMWGRLLEKIGNEYGVAGVMANIEPESGLISNNLENRGNKELGISDSMYTDMVDTGEYKGFCEDRYGYGLAQWTHPERKKAFYDFAKAQGKSVGDFDVNIDYLLKELERYDKVWDTLLNAKSVKKASDAVLLGYEMPPDKSESNCEKRAKIGQRFYDAYASRSGYIVHEVTYGDNLSKIAKKYGTTVDAIVEANGITNKNLIRVGDELKIPKEKQNA
jgi:LysM repeat protein